MSAEASRRAFAALLALSGSALTVAVLAADRSSGLGVILAAVGVLVATFGLLDLVDAFEAVPMGALPPNPRTAAPGDAAPERPLATFAAPLALVGGALVLFIAAVRFATAGMLAVVPAAVVVPLAFLLLVAAVHRLGVTLGAPPGLLTRRGFWVVAGATLLYLPLLGSSSLIDPWEGHYGEVAREMIARDDWISPWWAQDKWFWSKPVLDLWLEALSMRAFGVHAAAGAMLAPVAGFSPRPEWALRMPTFLFAVTGLYLLYKGVARTFGERAALLAALVLATMPQFFLMAHQATTDMALVASLTAAMGLLLLGAAAGVRDLTPSAAIRIGGRVLHVGVAHLVLAGIVLAVLPQILYLASRNLTLHVGAGFSLVPHADVFWSGSPGNCTVPGNAPCERHAPLSAEFTPALQALLWTAALFVVLVSQRAERRLERVATLGAFLCAAVATMAKGPVGVALPAVAYLGALTVTGRLRRLARLPIVSGSLLVLVATLPWYVAVFARHGTAFTDELVFRHMVGRAVSHLHDTNAGDDVSFRYYLWQLGCAAFGWAGLLPVAFAFWPRARPGEDPHLTRRQRAARVLALLWVALAFTLFASMPTKFHHYIFPALPPAALLVGLFLDELLDRAPRAARGALGAAVLGGAAVVLLVARDLATPGVAGEARLINLVTYNYQRAWPDTYSARPMLTGFGVAFAVALAGLAVPRLRRGATIALLGVATAFAGWGVDGYLVRVAPHWGQRALIEAYYRERGSDADPIAAYNMNWRGETFYMGNHVAVFPAGGKIPTWVEARRHEGARSVFFLTEHGRVAALRKEVGEPKTFTMLTEARDNNKFVLVKATYE